MSDEHESEWMNSIPEEFREDANVSKHESMESLVKEYVNLVPAIGKKGVLLPKDGDEEDQNRFFNEIGRPESHDKYDLSEIELPEGVDLDAGLVEAMQERMWKRGVTQKMWPGIVQDFAEVQSLVAQQQSQTDEGDAKQMTASLQKELGGKFKESMNLAGRAMQKLYGEGAQEMLMARLPDGTLLGNHKGFIQSMMQFASFFGEDKLVGELAAQAHGHRLTPSEAKAEWQQLQGDSKFMNDLFDREAPGHMAAVAKRDELYVYMYPEDSAA